MSLEVTGTIPRIYLHQFGETIPAIGSVPVLKLIVALLLKGTTALLNNVLY